MALFKRGDLFLYGALALVLAASCLLSLSYLRDRSGEGELVLEIASGDGTTVRYAMAALEPGEAIELRAGGYNRLAVEAAGVRMVSADCPGGDCLRMPAIRSEGGVIVCLPHKRVVRIRRADGPASLDALVY